MDGKITANSFFTDTPPVRMIGTECEYNVQEGSYQNGKRISPGSYIDQDALSSSGIYFSGSFLENGGRIYYDVGHLEYDTPNCLGPRQAAAADLAGIAIVTKIVQASQLPHRGIYRLTGSDNIPGKSSQTSGYHENYLVPRCITEGHLIDSLLPAYAATCLWGQNGIVSKTFGFSQKILNIKDTAVERRITRRTGQSKPMFLIPPPDFDNDVIGSKAYARIERRYADSGQSPTVRYLQFATMSLVLRIIEHRKRLNLGELNRLALESPSMAAAAFAGDLTLKRTVRTQEGRKVTAANIQDKLADLAQKLSAQIELPEDERRAIEEWVDINKRFANANPQQAEYKSLITELDVAARHSILARNRSPQSITNNDKQVVAESLLWDRIIPKGAAQKWWERFPSSIITPSDIAEMQTKVPQTSAAIRAHFLKNYTDVEYMNWTTIRRKGQKILSITDPYRTSI